MGAFAAPGSAPPSGGYIGNGYSGVSTGGGAAPKKLNPDGTPADPTVATSPLLNPSSPTIYTSQGNPAGASVPGNPAAPAPYNWQQQEEQDALAAWNARGGSVASDEAGADAERGATQSAADKAYANYMGQTNSNVAGYTASNLANYKPSAVANWLTSLQPGNSPVAPAAVSGGIVDRGAGAGPSGAGAGTALGAYNTDALDAFDPAAAGDTYAKGAYGAFSNNLKDQLKTLTNKSVGAGRFNTGLLDADTGATTTRLASDFDNAIASAAVQFSGQKESALSSAAGLNLSRAQGIDANALSAKTEADNYSLSSASAAAAAAQQRAQLGLQGAEYIDTQGYDRATGLDAGNWARDTYLDTSNMNQAKTGLDEAITREANAARESDTARDRGDTYASATRTWAANDRAAQDARDAAAQAQAAALAAAKRNASGGGTPVQQGIGNTPDPYLTQKRQAAALGVPFIG